MSERKISALSAGIEKMGLKGGLAQRYFELQKLRQQVRIAECGRVIPFSDLSLTKTRIGSPIRPYLR